MPNKPMMIRPPERTRDLIHAIRKKTGMTITQIIIQAIECLAEKYSIALTQDH